jgi:rRNA maturation RNase YbeY
VKVPVSLASVRNLAAGVLRAERARVGALSITFVGPSRIRSLNRKFLRHDRETDVVAFALTAPTSGPLLPPASGLFGDVYICPAVAARNARAFGITPREELRRLVVHGLLHVLGHDHPAGASRTGSPMWKRQERLLKTLTGRRG